MRYSYTVRIQDADHVVEVEELSRGRFSARLSDGRCVEANLVGSSAQVDALSADTSQPAADPSQPAAAAAEPPSAGHGVLTAPMPGVVLSVDVVVGSSVSRGQTLLVLEAMKMKNDLKAELDGVVSRVAVAPGDQVKHGDPLVEFEG